MIDRALRMAEAGQFKRYRDRVGRINELEPEMEELKDSELREEADALREHARNGEPLDALLPDAYALCREAARRTLAMRHFAVQLIGGIALPGGLLAGVKAGEGKTRAAHQPD